VASVLKMVDEYFGSTTLGRVPGGELRLASERVTPREIIRRRVESEIAAIAKDRAAAAPGARAGRSFIIDLDASETQLNGEHRAERRAPPRAPLDALREAERAVSAFERRVFIMLVDEQQVEDVDAAITLRPSSEVVFLYLTPLKGG